MAKIKVVEMFSAPKQFIVANETYSEDIWSDDPGNYDDDTRDDNQSDKGKLKFQREASMDATQEDFDLDFMMPSRVREILSSEGLTKDVIDKSVKHLEKKHRRALHLTVLQEK
jgi:hypothetical protein